MTLDPHDRRSVSAFVRREGRGVVATVSRQGRPQAALVSLAALDDGALIFNSDLKARKVLNIAADDRVAVVVGVAGDLSVQLEGPATITRAAERERCGLEYHRQFPGSRALHQDFALVVVRPSWVRVYDTSDDAVSVAEADWSAATQR